MNDIHYYEVDLLWNSGTQGTVSASGITPDIEVVTPPAFPNGIAGKWTPEHLFVASVNACLMSTFILVAGNSKFEYINFECSAVGKFENVDGKFSLTEIVLRPKLTIPYLQDGIKAERILEMSENACAISNSLKTKITLKPNIVIQ